MEKNESYFRYPTQTLVGRVKANYFWMCFVKFSAPIYRVIWEYIINFPEKVLYLKSPYRAEIRPALKNNCIEMINNNPHFLQFGQWLNSRISSDLLKKHKEQLLERKDDHAYFSTLQTDVDVETRLGLIKFAVSDEVLNMILPYFGVVPKLNSIQLMYNIVHPALDESGSKEWHQDDGYYKSLNIFMCISDVDEKSGYYRAYGADACERHASVPLDRIDTRLSPWKNRRHTADNLFRFIPKKEPLKLIGPPGTAALVDNGVCYHKGGYCLEKDRIMIQFHFSTESHISTPSVQEQLEIQERSELKEILNNSVKKYIMSGTEQSLRRRIAMKFKNPAYLIGRRIFCYYLRPNEI